MLTNGNTAMARRLSSSVVGFFAGFCGTADIAGCSAVVTASTGSPSGAVRCTPPGPISNAQASMIAIMNPSTTSAVTSVTVHSGRFRLGNTVEATSMTIQPATAYKTITRITRRRWSSDQILLTGDCSGNSAIYHFLARRPLFPTSGDNTSNTLAICGYVFTGCGADFRQARFDPYFADDAQPLAPTTVIVASIRGCFDSRLAVTTPYNFLSFSRRA